MDRLNQQFAGTFDFLYMPIGFPLSRSSKAPQFAPDQCPPKTPDLCFSTSSTVSVCPFDFFYWPSDFESARHLGFAFVDFRDVHACKRFEELLIVSSVDSACLASAVPRCVESARPACSDWKGTFATCVVPQLCEAVTAESTSITASRPVANRNRGCQRQSSSTPRQAKQSTIDTDFLFVGFLLWSKARFEKLLMGYFRNSRSDVEKCLRDRGIDKHNADVVQRCRLLLCLARRLQRCRFFWRQLARS